jgi:isocitrate/isopropylmalate dehydrogenase
MLPGSGIGPELMNYVKEVFRYTRTVGRNFI